MPREERDQQDAQQLDGLDGDRADAEPDARPGACHIVAEPQREDREQQAAAEQQVAEAQQPGEQRRKSGKRDVGGPADGDPEHLSRQDQRLHSCDDRESERTEHPCRPHEQGIPIPPDEPQHHRGEDGEGRQRARHQQELRIHRSTGGREDQERRDDKKDRRREQQDERVRQGTRT